MKTITVVTKDRVGLLADVSGLLGENNINISSIAAEAHGKTGILRIGADNPAKTKEVLKKAGFDVSDFEMIVVRLKNKPGELARLTRELVENGIDIKNAYQFPADKGEVVFGFETSNVAKAKKVAASFA
ncbi:ACT domain protein [Candidatus Norongarragalina meridionalis]|nr:ACT domain protein [Candidatus Norongarragalina meridionalis]